ncbi:MAG TPA: YCF48-related protein, partial [Gaiellaceae bacterium]|nr:YCF48-related protein [Gaiellaceae bacterium]
MRRAAAPIALALALLATAGGSSATPILDVWTPHGPAGPLIVALAASPDGPGTVYASSETNVWKSTDSGNTWSPTGDGPTNFAVSLVADPADVDRLIAGTSDGAIWVTSDGGDHWAPPSSGFSGSFWPLLSWTAAGLFALVDGALYTSADGGQIWTAAGTPPDGGARSLLVVSADAIYVGTELGTIQFSYDGGDNWIDRHDGIPTQIEPGSPYPPSIERLAVDPADAQTLYAEVNPLGVYRSTDGGVNWEEVVTPRPGHALTRVATLATTPTTVLAVVGTDVVSSTDGGATWSVAAESPKSAGGGMDSEFFGDPSNPGTVYAGGFGVYRSTDAGGTFALTSGGMGGTLVESLAAVPGVEGQYLAGTWEGVFRSDDDAGTWQHASDGMFGQALDIAADPTDSDRFYLVAAGDLWVTSDGAATWDPSSLTVPEVVYAVDASANSVLVGASTTIHRSTDGGESWSSTDLPLIHDSVNDVAIDPNDIEHVYAGTTDGLFRSVDGGANWTKIDSRHISAVSIAPDSVVYVLAEGAVDAFTPGGDSLVVASAGLSTYAHSLETDPTDADTVYAGTQQGAYKTADGGQHWVKLATAGMVSPFVSDILVP